MLANTSTVIYPAVEHMIHPLRYHGFKTLIFSLDSPTFLPFLFFIFHIHSHLNEQTLLWSMSSLTPI
jgi:hypothetical protein